MVAAKSPRKEEGDDRDENPIIWALGLVMFLALPAALMSEEGRWAAVVFEEVEDQTCGGRNFNKLLRAGSMSMVSSSVRKPVFDSPAGESAMT